MNRSMFDEASIKEHIGTSIKYREKVNELKVLEDKFVELCSKYKLNYSHDCNAEETTYFKTLNYTSYANMFIMSPLSNAMTTVQVGDAISHNVNSIGHIDWIRDDITKSSQGKYTLADGEEMPIVEAEDFSDLAILTGSNKYKETMSHKKLEALVSILGSRLVIKPHPLTNKHHIEYLETCKGEAILAPPESNLYDLVNKASKIHTTHASETPLICSIMGKKISPIDKFGSHSKGVFNIFSNICFTYDNPIEVLDKVFASHKSGVICPDVDVDWETKMEDYIKYIVTKRNTQRGFYYEY